MTTFVWVIALGALTGCIFDTRDAEPPGGPGSTWVVPSVPSQVFTNMRNGLEDHTGVNYKRSIEDIFTFVPLPEDLNNPTLIGAFDNWTADVEKEVVDKLLANASNIEVSFTNIDPIFDQTPFANFRVDYSLRVVDNSLPPDTTFYKGKAQFDMRDGSKGWQLIRWEDIERVSGFATWGFLRGTLRQL
jgi:hypothetical protein